MNRFAVFLTVIMVVSISYSQRTIPINLEQLVRDAGVIVDATVVKTETGKDPETGLLVTWVTMEINENFYGTDGKRYSFKQYGGESEGVSNYLAHLPRYFGGERSFLFLTPPSTIGMQSPVGMQQGKFVLVQEQDQTSKVRIKNITVNPSLLKGLSTSGQLSTEISSYNKADGSMEYDEFAALVRSIVHQIKN